MNFFNFLTSKASLLNFNLLTQSGSFQRENTILVAPTKENQKNVVEPTKVINSSVQGLKEQKDVKGQKQILTKEFTQLLTQEQMLINQYMELQLKYMENCLKINQNTNSQIVQITKNQEKSAEIESSNKQEHLKKKIKKRNKCGHDDKTHYAKGMCSNCYHKYGRTKKPWNCPHDKLYAAGMCQNCYINNYNRKKRQEKQCQKDDYQKIEDQSFQENENLENHHK